MGLGGLDAGAAERNRHQVPLAAVGDDKHMRRVVTVSNLLIWELHYAKNLRSIKTEPRKMGSYSHYRSYFSPSSGYYVQEVQPLSD